jgi:hypothetical protein
VAQESGEESVISRLSGQGCVETPPPLDLFALSNLPTLCRGILNTIGAPALSPVIIH